MHFKNITISQKIEKYLICILKYLKYNAELEGDGNISKFEFPKSENTIEDIQKHYSFTGDLLEIFTNNSGPLVHKWHHYIPLYDKYFSHLRNKEIRFLEIGVSKGGSLQMWRKYFGDRAIIYGIDIDEECKKYDGLSGCVRIGSQIDKNFLDDVINEMGGVDVVLDDGSHHMEHVKSTLTHLFPKISRGGIYFIEDLHTSYWEKWGGGFLEKNNFFNLIRGLIDDIHHWYHNYGIVNDTIASNCTGIHIHDSIIVLEKNTVYRPTHSMH